MMVYYRIKHNALEEPYITVKNWAHDAQAVDNESSSHWTWHITQRGVEHLCRDMLGKPQPMPTAITYEQVQYLRDLNMLCRSDGTLIGSIRPEKQAPPPKKRHAKTGKKVKEVSIQQISRRKPATITPSPMPQKPASKPAPSLWARLKTFLGFK